MYFKKNKDKIKIMVYNNFIMLYKERFSYVRIYGIYQLYKGRRHGTR